MTIIDKYGIDKVVALANAHYKKYGRDEKFVELEEMICDSRDAKLALVFAKVEGIDMKKLSKAVASLYPSVQGSERERVKEFFATVEGADKEPFLERFYTYTSARNEEDILWAIDNLKTVDKDQIFAKVNIKGSLHLHYALAKRFPEMVESLQDGFTRMIKKDDNNLGYREYIFAGKFANLEGADSKFIQRAIENMPEKYPLIQFLEMAEKPDVASAQRYLLKAEDWVCLIEFLEMREKLEKHGKVDGVAVARTIFKSEANNACGLNRTAFSRININKSECATLYKEALETGNANMLIGMTKISMMNNFKVGTEQEVGDALCRFGDIEQLVWGAKNLGSYPIDAIQRAIVSIADVNNINHLQTLRNLLFARPEQDNEIIEKFLIENKQWGELIFLSTYSSFDGEKLAKAFAKGGDIKNIVGFADTVWRCQNSDVCLQILYEAVEKRFPQYAGSFAKQFGLVKENEPKDLYDILT